MVRLRVTAVIALVAVGAGLAACGGGGGDRVIASVGASRITVAELAHWMSVMAPEHVVPDPPSYRDCLSRRMEGSPQFKGVLAMECRQEYRTLRKKALDFLISSDWVRGEAREQGLAPSRAEVDRALAAQRRSGPDSTLRVETELTASKLHRKLTGGGVQVAPAQVAAAYRRDLKRYETPERRYLYAVERLENRAQAEKVKREILAGRSMAGISIYESVQRPPGRLKTAILRAVFAARLNELVGPVPVYHAFYVFKVIRIAPRVLTPPSKAYASIERELIARQQRRRLASAVAKWRGKWRARTYCARGYVVEKCKQYTGAPTHEDPLSLT